MSIRKADMSDLDAMVDVGLAALPMDPQWDYRLRYRKQYPEDTRRFTRERFKMFLENEPGNWQVMVAELPSREDSSVSRVAAFAAWQLPPVDQVVLIGADKVHQREFSMSVEATQSHGSRSDSRAAALTTSEAGSSDQRQDADPKRMRAFEESLAKARAHHFKRVYGENRIHLRLLVTHPDYQRRGAGANLVTWGIEIAKENNLAVTLFASPIGGQLYRKLGFRDLSVIKILVDGESESVCMGVMAYLPTRDEA